MDELLEKYLRWRFKMNNHAKYQRCMDEWLSGVTDQQLWYFRQEMNRLIERGQYAIL